MENTNKNWEDYLSKLHPNFLTPSEDNHSELLRTISLLLDNMPQQNSNDSVIGHLNDEHTYLNACPHVPIESVTLEERLKVLGKVFSGTIKFQHPNVMHNLTPAPLISNVAASSVVQLYNINPAWDFISAGFQNLERQIVKQLADLVGWTENPGGISTTGGKGCISYAIQLGLKRAVKNIVTKGIHNTENAPVVITSADNHKSIDYCCRMLGIGIDNCLRSRTHRDETMDVEHCKELIEKAIEENRPIACIILSGGNTAHLSIDDLKSIRAHINKLVEEGKLSYRPYIYFDSCVSWPWLFFKEYDFKKNNLEIDSDVLAHIEAAYNKLSFITLADGCSFDFHKTGNSPYQSSLFLTNSLDELYTLGLETDTENSLKPQGNNFLYNFIVEHSRNATGIVSIWDSLQTMGVKGYQSYIAHLMTLAITLRKNLTTNEMELLNDFSLSPACLYFPTSLQNPMRYCDLLKCNDSIIKKYNEYTFSLFKYFLDKSQNGLGTFIFRYIPQYRKAECGTNVAILLIYPMSIHSNKKIIKKLSNDILSMKSKFDKEYTHNAINENEVPNYVPR